MSLRLLAVLAMVTVAPGLDPSALDDLAKGITAGAIADHVRTLASDEYEGRGPGTRGEALTVSYVEKAFRDMGLPPAYGDNYRQHVPLVEMKIVGVPKMDATFGSQHIALTPGVDAVAGLVGPSASANVSHSPLVFGGFGIVAPEYGWDDYGGMDLTGKTVVLLYGDPGTASHDPTVFDGRRLSRHGLPGAKFREAMRRGAAAVIMVHTDVSAGYPWAAIASGSSGRPQDFLEPEGKDAVAPPPPGVWVSESTARHLFNAGGLDLDAEIKAATVRGFRAHAMNGVFDVAFATNQDRLVTDNVVGVVRGSEKPDECVVVMAHWDHLGRNTSLKGDQIYNGAVDNATGVAALLEIARAVRAAPRAPKRTLVLVATTAEERGLYGSEYLAQHPVCPVGKTVAAIAIDALFPYGDYTHMTVAGYGNSELDDVLKVAAARFGRKVQDDGQPEAGAFYRADHAPWVRRGVPGFLAVGGPDNAAPPDDPQVKALSDYVKYKYHRPSDEYDAATWDLKGIEGDARILFEFTWMLADDPRRPNWYWNSPYRALGDARLDAADTPAAAKPAS